MLTKTVYDANGGTLQLSLSATTKEMVLLSYKTLNISCKKHEIKDCKIKLENWN